MIQEKKTIYNILVVIPLLFSNSIILQYQENLGVSVYVVSLVVGTAE